MSLRSKHIIGIDEVGRGPLAGPVGVGAVMVTADFDWKLLPGVTDSKQLTEEKREAIYTMAQEQKAAGRLDYAVSLVSARVIDEKGIVAAIDLAMRRSLKKLHTSPVNWTSVEGWEETVTVKLDGGLRAPDNFLYQETIIKGDSKEKVIGLASIMAKVTRDRHMRRIATRAAYSPYDLHIHKGYGTPAHRAAIAKNGLSPAHRASYCRNIKML